MLGFLMKFEKSSNGRKRQLTPNACPSRRKNLYTWPLAVSLDALFVSASRKERICHKPMVLSVELLVFLCVFIPYQLVASENMTTALLDKSEFERRPRVKYHLYDPQLFTMYTECLPKLKRPCYSNSGYNNFVYMLDVLFLESIIALNQSVHPSEATLFIIPVFYNQATVPDFPCFQSGNELKHIAQMYEVLHSLGHYKPGVRNHFLMANHYAAGLPDYSGNFVYEAELIVGRFENPSIFPPTERLVLKDADQIFSVGYATKAGVFRQCSEEHASHGKKAPLPISRRKYLWAFTGGTVVGNPSFYHRNVLYGQTRNNSVAPADTFISVYKKGEPFSHANPLADGRKICRNSLLYLSIRGDTPTTDRILAVFEYLTLLGVLSVERESLLPLLPFSERVPWDEIIIWIDTDAFIKDPVHAVRSAALALSDSEKERRFNLMKKHRRDVLWAYEESVAVFNVLEDASSRVKVLR